MVDMRVPQHGFVCNTVALVQQALSLACLSRKSAAAYNSIQLDMGAEQPPTQVDLGKESMLDPGQHFVSQQGLMEDPFSEYIAQKNNILQPTNGTRSKMIDRWKTEPQPPETTTWIGSTNFEEKAYCKEQLDSADEEHRPAIKSKAAATPFTPKPQEAQEHNLTHLPCLTVQNWCPICLQGRRQATNHLT